MTVVGHLKQGLPSCQLKGGSMSGDGRNGCGSSRGGCGPPVPCIPRQPAAPLPPLHGWAGPAPRTRASTTASTSLPTASRGPASTWLKAQPGLRGPPQEHEVVGLCKVGQACHPGSCYSVAGPSCPPAAEQCSQALGWGGIAGREGPWGEAGPKAVPRSMELVGARRR